ncbi:unnamed protein product [Pelagomonas calceolata]|uniref:Integrin alpha beta-propellor repeat protein n=1 Tax=Pelagomonas calceolata TaxID=35677 RepID=A0A8J2T242_9STRA|nr:unnamed protein product [Pelagomonas calceolata]
MHAFAFICLAAAAPHAWGLLDARARRRGREAGKNRRLSDDFSERVKMAASDAAAGDKFGYSVAIDGDTVVIGAPYAGSWSGSVYVLRASDGAELAKLTASDAAAGDLFGSSVAIDGSTIVVGATNDDDAGSNSGSVYVFEKSTWGTYDQVAKLTASDAAANDLFGSSVAIDGATIVIGASSAGTGGAVYVFRTTDGGATYVEVAKLTADDAAAIDQFGISVAIAGDTIVVGVDGDDDGGSASGSAYVFRTTDGATYVEVAKLTADDAASIDQFGGSVAIDGNTIVVGADQYYSSGSGSAYVFLTTDDGTTYVEVAKLTASDAASNDYFGRSVAIDGNTIVVGADGDDDAGSKSGSAYVFRTSDSGASYDQVAKLTAADAAASDQFGGSVAIAGGTIVVGAYGDDDAGTYSNSGSVYVFEDESSWWDYFSSDAAATRRLPSATILTAAAAVLAAILA